MVHDREDGAQTYRGIRGYCMKHCIYIGCLYDEPTFGQLFTGPNKPMQAASKYHRLLCEGLAANEVSVCAYSTLPVNRVNCSRKVIRKKPVIMNGFRIVYPTIVNFPGIKHILLFVQAFLKTLFAPRGTVLLYDCLVIASSYGACFGAMLRGIKRVCIVTDLPEFMCISESKIGKIINDKLLDLSSGYLFLTEQMNEKVNLKRKPYVVMEGHVDRNMKKLVHMPFKSTDRKLIYAGGLAEEYGLKTLCDAFIAVAKPGESLHLYGDGTYREKIVALCKEHDNVVYHGNVLNTEVVAAELDATLLVNPRPADGEFTKYSFPSKTMEYMVSGTPVAMTKLPGMPDEYCNYVHIFEGDAISMGTKLREILDMPIDVLCDFGAKARDFVLTNKNNKVQAKKVIDLVEHL